MSTILSEPVAPQKLPRDNARVFITFYRGSRHLAKKLLQSAEASGNDTSKYIFVGTDGSKMDGFKNLSLDLPQGNPVSANRAFMAVAEICFRNQDDFLFLDSDVTFLRPNVVERMTEELIGRQGAVLGQPIWVQNDKFQGWSCNGNAAYKWEVWKTFQLEKFPIPDDQPFDLWLSKKFFQRYFAGTGLQHQTMHVSQIKDLDWIPEESVMHHPCTDGSVADCVVEKYLTHA